MEELDRMLALCKSDQKSSILKNMRRTMG